MMNIEEAGAILQTKARALPSVELSILQAYGYVLAEDLTAKITQPPFRRSAMDGYAVSLADITGASAKTPVSLPVAGVIYAGDASWKEKLSHKALRIMTGAPVPDWANAVVPQEDTDEGEEQVQIFVSGELEWNCVPMGEDFFAGDILAKKGTVIDSYTIASAAAAGVQSIAVSRSIKAAILTTGNELVGPADTIRMGQIYNSNAAFFESRLRALHCDVIENCNVPDAPKEIEQALKHMAKNADFIVTTGGISVGKKDYLPTVLKSMGAEILFQGLRVKPGSPTLAADYHGTSILCLSGNPYSSIAMFEMLFPYYETKALGLLESCLKTGKAICKNGFFKESPVRRLLRGRLDMDGGVWIPQGQRNGQLRDGIGCDCLVEIPEGTAALLPETQVTIYRYKKI